VAEILLFHHVQGLTTGVLDFAQKLRDAGHVVHTPDLFEGRIFATIDDGLAYVDDVGFDTVMQRGTAAAEGLPTALVYGGFSLGVLPAQSLAQSRPGARGAVLFHSCVPASEFGTWPHGVPVQVHGMDADPFFAGEGDIDAARALVAEVSATGTTAQLWVYAGEQHLFADNSLESFVPDAAALVLERTLAFLA
jgi:dienelactone hydrolase